MKLEAQYIIGNHIVLVDDKFGNNIIYNLKQDTTYEIDDYIKNILISFQKPKNRKNKNHETLNTLIRNGRIKETKKERKYIDIFNTKKIIKYSKQKQSKADSKAIIYLTNSCNLNCIHCGLDSGKKLLLEMDEKYFQNIIDQLCNCGFNILQFSGGEPFLKKELLIKLIKNNYKRFDIISINTNGLLIKKEDIDQFNKIKNLIFYVSIYGYDKNSFRKNTNRELNIDIKENIKYILGKGFEVRASLSMHQSTIKDLEKYNKYIKDLGIKKTAFIGIIPTGRAYNNYIDLIGNRTDYQKALKKIPSIIDESFSNNQIIDHPRHLVKKRITIYANGEVLPSEFFPISFGNIQNDKLETILTTKIALYYLNDFNVDNIDFCNKCAYRYICKSICPSFIYCTTGSIKNPPISCSLALKEFYSKKPINAFFKQ